MGHFFISGAGRGIGFETALALANGGNNVIATSRSVEGLMRLRTLQPDFVEIIPADLTQPEEIGTLVKKLEENSIQLDGIVHNAGSLKNKPFTELTDSDWLTMLNVNLMAPVRLSRALIPLMNKKSHILHIGSMGGYQGSEKFTGLSGYSSTKGALAILAESLAGELRHLGISSNCLCLGAVETEMLQEAFPGVVAPVTSAEMGNYIANFLLNGHRLYNGKILPVALSDPA